MLMLLPIVVALAAGDPGPAASAAPAAQPASSSAARPTPLTEIGRVRALPACVPIVAHANGAITQALDNDRTLAIMTTNLRATDFDRLNSLQRRNAIEALMRQAEAIRVASSAGDAEIKKLREYAKASPDPKRKEELKTFADALGGALYRQKKAAVELMRDVTIMRGREDVAEIHAIKQPMTDDQAGGSRTMQRMVQAGTPLQEPLPNYNKQMVSMGETLDTLNSGILMDEGIAADHSIAATTGC
jgi:hypothetical protein